MPLANTIPRGVDSTVNLSLTWKDGTPIDLTKLTGLVIYLSYASGDIFLKYSLYMTSNADKDINLSSLGYKQLHAVNAKKGMVKFIINADDTEKAALGTVNFSGKCEYIDKCTDSGFYHKAINPIVNFAEIIPSVGSNQINF